MNKGYGRSWLARAAKKIYLSTLIKRQVVKKVLFIMGCQRSGTTLMTEIFDRDIRVKVYGEFSSLSAADRDRIRLNPPADVRRELDENRTAFIVLKPLVESQNASVLLDYFTGSRCLWMFRHYLDVAHSNLTHFGLGNGIRNLRPIVNGEAGNWRSQGISRETADLVSRMFSEEMPPYDAAALFWYVRNVLFFERGLDRRPDILLLRYEDLVRQPYHTMQGVYSFAGFPFPGKHIIATVHSRSLRKGEAVEITPAIRRLCETVLARLERHQGRPMGVLGFIRPRV